MTEQHGVKHLFSLLCGVCKLQDAAERSNLKAAGEHVSVVGVRGLQKRPFRRNGGQVISDFY